MLKVYICPHCGRYRFVTSINYTCYQCKCQMSLADIEYEDYIQLGSDERKAITNLYIDTNGNADSGTAFAN